MLTKNTLSAAVCAALLALTAPTAMAQAFEQAGKSEVSIKSYKDQISARAAARRAAEREAVRLALKTKLNVDGSNPKLDGAIPELVTSLVDNLKTTFTTEGDLLTASTRLTVDSAQLTDLARSLGLQDMNAMEAASILFIVDEYWGVATNLDPAAPLVNETEYFHDKSSSSDTSARASGSAFSDTSATSSSSASYSGSLAASSKEASSSSASQNASASGSSSSSLSGSAHRAGSYQDGNGAGFAASQSAQLSASQKDSFAGSSASSSAAASNSDRRIAVSEQSASAQASDKKNVAARSFSGEQKNVHNQRDVVSVRTRTVFPDVSNARPSDAQAALIPQRLAQVTGQYGLRYTPERDLRETGKGRMLIADIEQQRRVDEYTTRASKNPYNAKYVVYGTSVMSAEGKSASGQTLCSGMIKLDSYSVDTGRGLVAGTLNKRAQGSSDQDCRSNLSTALATELAQTVGNAATRELQLAAAVGQSYTVTLYSQTNISRRVGGPFEDALRQLGANMREDKRTDATRIYVVAAKGGDFVRRVEKMLDGLGEGMTNAEVQSKGNRVVVCIEGRCPTEF